MADKKPIATQQLKEMTMESMNETQTTDLKPIVKLYDELAKSIASFQKHFATINTQLNTWVSKLSSTNQLVANVLTKYFEENSRQVAGSLISQIAVNDKEIQANKDKVTVANYDLDKFYTTDRFLMVLKKIILIRKMIITLSKKEKFDVREYQVYELAFTHMIESVQKVLAKLSVLDKLIAKFYKKHLQITLLH